jgi:predicted acetyltransferase
VLRNLAQFYEYEFTPFLDHIHMNEDGLFDVSYVDTYFTDPDCHPFFICVDEERVGFVLIKAATDSDPEQTLVDFFVMRKHSGQGIGKAAARQVFDMFPGKWRIGQVEKNLPARAFWRSVISSYTQGNFTERVSVDKSSIQEFDNSL